MRVYATTDLDDGEPAETSAVPGTPGALQDVRVDPGTCSGAEASAGDCTASVTVHWDAPAAGDGAGQITGYEIQWRSDNPVYGCAYGSSGTGCGSATVSEASATSHAISVATSRDTPLRMRPLNGTIAGPWSEETRFVAGGPSRPRNIDLAYDPQTETFTASWEAPRFTGGNSVTGYVVQLEDCTGLGCVRLSLPRHFFTETSTGPDVQTVSFNRTAESDTWYALRVWATTEEGDYVHEGVEAVTTLVFH